MAQQELWLALLGVMALVARLGVGLYLSGVSRCKNAGTTLTRVMTDLCAAVLVFFAFGYAILSGHWGAMLGLNGSFGGPAFFMAAIIPIATGTALGAILERTAALAPLVATLALAGVVVPLAARWAWTGWLAHLGFVDVGGAAALHVCGGVFALTGAIFAGPRGGKYNHDGSTNLIPGHSFPQTAAGALAIAVGLLAQLVGCAIFRQVQPALAAADGLLAAAAGGMAGLVLGRIRYAIIDPRFVLLGLLGGLVSASAGAGIMPPVAAVGVGAIAGVLVPWASVIIDLRFKIDDPGSSIAIFFVGGAWGLLAAGAIVDSEVHRLTQVAVEIAGITAIAAMAMVVSSIVFLALKHTVGLRLGEADELDGSDLVEHDMNAYPDFQQTMIKSYHLRET